MQELFSNNAEGVLAAGIDDNETTITLADTPGAANFQLISVYSDEFQRATISDLNAPGATEIVRIVERDGLVFTVQRGLEGDAPSSWPAGAKLSARVTAGMLGSFVAQDEGRISTGSYSFVVNSRPAVEGGQVQIGGWPVLQLGRARYSGSAEFQDRGMTHEAVGGTHVVSLGTTHTWVSNGQYYPGEVVLPTTPNGFQYSYEKTPFGNITQVVTEPEFDTYGEPLAVVNPSDPDKTDGYWMPTPDPVALHTRFSGFYGGVMLTEVGFLCLDYGATTPPTISVSTGQTGDPVPIVSNVSLSQIDGAEQVWRHVITDIRQLQREIRFAVVTPATGTFVGRFYWRGVAFGTSW